MRLTKGTDYGARGVIHLAKHPAESVILVGDIASEEDLPESYLAKIFQDLAKEGIVRSHRGAKGGFSLARPATEISLRQVVEAIEGPIALTRCLAPWGDCERKENCALYPIFAEAQTRLLETLERTSLHDLAADEGLLATSLGS